MAPTAATLEPSPVHRPFANGGADPRECRVRKEGRHRLRDGESAQGAQRPEYAYLGAICERRSRTREKTMRCAASS